VRPKHLRAVNVIAIIEGSTDMIVGKPELIKILADTHNWIQHIFAVEVREVVVDFALDPV
jgi:hypothetical protein